MAMYGLGKNVPKWRTKVIPSGFISNWDGEWFYHFSDGGYEDIEWVEIKITNQEQRKLVLAALQRIHVPGCETKNGFKVLGYASSGTSIEYL